MFPKVSKIKQLQIKHFFHSKATTLKPRGSAPLVPRFSESTPSHFVADIGDNAFCSVEVVGNPAPQIEWFKVVEYDDKFEY